MKNDVNTKKIPKNKDEEIAKEKPKRAKNATYIKNIGIRISQIAAEKDLTQSKIVTKLHETVEYETTQPTINRYFSGENEPSASFIKAFCQTFELSSDYVLGLNDLAISAEKVTPFVVLNNLVLLLDQFDFNIEFNDNHSKVMLTTDNEIMIHLLPLIKKAERCPAEQIEYLCKSFDLVWHDKTVESKEQYYSNCKTLYINITCGKIREDFRENSDLLDWEKDIINPLKKELDIEEPLSLEALYAKKWEHFDPEKKYDILSKFVREVYCSEEWERLSSKQKDEAINKLENEMNGNQDK